MHLDYCKAKIGTIPLSYRAVLVAASPASYYPILYQYNTILQKQDHQALTGLKEWPLEDALCPSQDLGGSARSKSAKKRLASPTESRAAPPPSV